MTKRTPRPALARDPALHLWVVLSRAHAALSARVEADIARHGLTPSEFGALEALYHKGPLLLGELQRKVLVSSGGITYVIDRLAARGLVERLACPTDRRARFAGLTEAGKSLVAEIFPEHREAVRQAVAGLDPEEVAEAAALLKKLGMGAEAV